MSNNSPHFFSSKSPDFTSDSKDRTPTGGEDFKACEAEKKREVAKGREAEKRKQKNDEKGILTTPFPTYGNSIGSPSVADGLLVLWV